MSAEKDLVHRIRRAKPLTSEEGMNILKRDRFRCQYCGLDGMASFENSLIMSVDFVIPRARKGKNDPRNLVAACRPCNVIKGHHSFNNFEEAKAYIVEGREKLRKEWEARMATMRSRPATA
jgi:5-methylcytosine-specific restriction endonuclease McrA